MDTYWDNKGKYQNKYDSLRRFIPSEGKADTDALEVLRIVGNIYHDHYNNGGGNLYLLSGEMVTLLQIMPRSWQPHIQRFCADTENVNNEDFANFLERFVDNAILFADFLFGLPEFEPQKAGAE